MRQLESYQEASGQEVNKEKSCFITHHELHPRANRKIKNWNGYKHSKFTFTYLRCPIYKSRKKIGLFIDLATKVINKVGGSQSNMLSAGGKALIIKHILQSQTLHLFTAMEPPSATFYQIEKYFSNFF